MKTLIFCLHLALQFIGGRSDDGVDYYYGGSGAVFDGWGDDSSWDTGASSKGKDVSSSDNIDWPDDSGSDGDASATVQKPECWKDNITVFANDWKNFITDLDAENKEAESSKVHCQKG